MEQSKAMEYESWKASSDVSKPRNIYIYIYIKLYEKQCELENWSVKEKNVLLMSLHIRLQRL